MTSSTTTKLADAISKAMPALDETKQRIAVTLYRALAKGRPVESAEIARRTALGLAQVDDVLGAWPGVFRDDPKTGSTARPTT